MSADLQMTDELTKAIQASLTPADMTAAVQAEIVKQETAAADATAAQVLADKAAADKAIADAAAAEVTPSFSRTEIIGGKEFTFESTNELELERMVNNAYKVVYAIQTTEAVPVVATVDPAIAQKAEEEKAAAKVELELQFKRGDISTADYIEKSGAIADYLAKQGVPLDALKATVNQNQNSQYEQDWATATESFKNSAAGADWPGGERNKHQLGLTLAALGLIDAEDKVAALAQAYNYMKQTDTMFPGLAEETAAKDAVTSADQTATKAAADKIIADKVAADAAALARTTALTAAAKTASASSALFGQSNGVSGGTGAATPAAAKIDIPADATPAEILDAWKKEQVRQGNNPDAAFRDTFGARRA